MALLYDPNSHLVFNINGNGNAEDTLNLTNKNSFGVLFKIKTTAPKQFCVRPNAGYLDPMQSVSVKIILQPQKDSKQLNARDKFLVQSFQDKIDAKSLTEKEAWALIESNHKPDVQEKKIRVRYVYPQTADTEAQHGTEGSSGAAPVPAAPKSPRRDTGRSPSPTDAFNASERLSTPDTSLLLQPEKSAEEKDAEPQSTTQQHVPESTAQQQQQIHTGDLLSDIPESPIDNTVGVTQGDEELKTAKSEIKKLQSEVQNYKRILDTKTNERASSQQQQQHQLEMEGFSLQAVGIFALIAFLIGYWLF
ncbi:phosphatidylinositol-binding protein scs2 [Mycoemilia scoparia]|uniref:Phosphatidylinositol-binding protein scs2 n=1 Tax=Mycoemilia scoparia TaxID=417184 RepID=A0A9W8DR37_9FUNG|nr:phosphatidylinositol-binding protein scs2 [Mycoemilia scoparia]